VAGSSIGYAEGIGSVAKFQYPSSVAVDDRNNLFITDCNNHRIRRITPQGKIMQNVCDLFYHLFTGMVSTFAGSGMQGSLDGTNIKAQFNQPMGIALDKKGNLFVACVGDHRIRKITPQGEYCLICELHVSTILP
jgi:DNA-binding beta-propeller fold protein YncE